MKELTAIVNAINALVTAAIGWIGSYVSCITASGNELLLFFVVFGFVGTGIGLIHRIIRVN